MEPGSGTLFVPARKSTRDKVLKLSRSYEEEAKLQAALSAAETQAPEPLRAVHNGHQDDRGCQGIDLAARSKR